MNRPQERTIRIGSRCSPLAMAQSRIVAEALRRCEPQLRLEVVALATGGDRAPGSLREIGGKGLFTAELEAALRDKSIDLAVHSAKDLPTAMADDLAIVAVPPRGDPRDAIVSRDGASLSQLTHGARVGTSSLRRRGQLLAARADLEIAAIRGNVETRLKKVLSKAPGAEGPLDAVVMAMAGLIRSGLAEKHAAEICPLDVDEFIPAAGQGALAVQAAADSRRIAALASGIDDAASHQVLLAERRVLEALGADCRSCVAVCILPAGDGWRGLGMVAREDGSGMVRAKVAAERADSAAEELTRRLAGKLRS